MKKLLFTIGTAMSFLVLNATGPTEIVLWEGTAICDDWTNQPSLLSNGGSELIYAGAEAGQELRFYTMATNSYWNLQIWEGHWEKKYISYSSTGSETNIEIDLTANGGYLSLYLTDEMLKSAQNSNYSWGGTFVGNGDNAIVTKITLVVDDDEMAGSLPLMINEIMQSNIDATMDDMNEFPDSWVELYNPNQTTVNTSQYRLGISDKESKAWQLPVRKIEGQQHLLIYCDKEAKGLHTNYRLESGKGCAVYLFRSGTVVDSVSQLKKQPAPNVAYGRQSDGAINWGYQALPTPGQANCGELCAELLPDPIFSEPGCILTSGDQHTLWVSMPEDAPKGVTLRYTTNGTEPVATSPEFPATGLTFSSTRVIRVKPFCKGYLSPRSTTQSYIFLGRDFSIPVISIVTDGRYFTDSKLGIYVNGSYKNGTPNYRHNWRRPINLEYFTAAGEESQLNQLCETRVAGAASRDCPIKSLALYAHKRFGEKRFDFELFPIDRPGENHYTSVVLRNAGNDFDYLYMRDAIIQRTMGMHTDLDHQAYSPAIFYLNGEYKGILNIRERANDHNIYTNYDGLEDIDLIENWWDLKAGTWDNYNAFSAFVNEHGHTWKEFDEWMDVVEFINLMIMNLFYCNLDFPGNNIVLWRPREEGGRWRFIAKDTDFGLGLYGRSSNYNTINWIYNPSYDKDNNWANQPDHTRLFRRLMEDETFAREFQDRCAIYMGDFMNYEGTWAIWKPMYDAISYEYPNHRKLINEWWPNYKDEMNNAQNWLKVRTTNFYNMVANYYELGKPRTLTINKELTEMELQNTPVQFNGVMLSANTFDGKFYQGRKVTLKGGVTEDGHGVTGWILKKTTTTGQITTSQIMGRTCEFVMPECSRYEINAIVGNDLGIDELPTDEEKQPTLIYDLNGIRHDHLVKGQNIMIMPNGEFRKVWF